MGNQIITRIAETMKNNLREVDIIGRYRGDEFLIVYHDTDVKAAFTQRKG
jgi:diguanylate cyclase (GGDEF)-like protein